MDPHLIETDQLIVPKKTRTQCPFHWHLFLTIWPNIPCWGCWALTSNMNPRCGFLAGRPVGRPKKRLRDGTVGHRGVQVIVQLICLKPEAVAS